MMRLLTPYVGGAFLAALAMWLAAVVPATAQVIQDPALPCRPPGFDLSPAAAMGSQENWSELSSPAFVVDRRPVGVVQMWNGSFQQNPYGFAEWWYDHEDRPGYYGQLPFQPVRNECGEIVSVNGYILPRVVQNLLDRLDAGFANGWRRFVLYLPAGGVRDQLGPFSSSQWWPMPEWKREALQVYLKAWVLAHEVDNVTLGVYMGYNIDNPCTICHVKNCREHTTRVGACTESQPNNYEYEEPPPPPPCPTCDTPPDTSIAPGHFPILADECHYQLACGSADRAMNHAPLPASLADAQSMYLNVQPWVEAGVTEVYLDAAAHPSVTAAFLDWAKAPMFAGRVRLGGEAVPLVGSPGQFTLDGTAVVRAPWVARGGDSPSGFLDNQNIFAGGNPGAVDPSTTEVGYWVNDANASLALLTQRAKQGYVLWTSLEGPNNTIAKRLEGWVQRIYSFGWIDVADFDGDGTINSADFAQFFAAYWATKAMNSQDMRLWNFVDGNIDNIDPSAPYTWQTDTDDTGYFITAYFYSMAGETEAIPRPSNPADAVFFGGPRPERVFGPLMPP